MKTPAIRGGATVMLFLWLALFSANAHADIDNAGILDNVLNRYSVIAATWAASITGHATRLFWTLVTISLVWTFGMMAMRKADIGEFFAEFARFTIFTGFFWWLLSNGPHFAVSIMDSLRAIGAGAAGTGPSLSPSGIVDIGFDIFAKVLVKSSIWSPFSSAVGIAISLITLIVLALIGVNMMLLLISGWILAYAGIFFLGFGGSRWTSDMAINYFKTVLSVGAQLCTMVLLVGIGKSFIDQFYTNISAGIKLNELAVILVVAIILLALVNKVPSLVGGLAMGGGTGSLGGGLGAGAALGAAAMAAAAAATAGAAVAAGAVNIAGGAQALMAAFSKASATESAGREARDFISAAAGGGAGAGDSGGGGSGGGSALAAAMGDDSGAHASSAGNSASSGSAAGNAEAGGERQNSKTASGDGKPKASETEANPRSDGKSKSGSTAGGATAPDKGSQESGGIGNPAGAKALATKAAKLAADTAANLAQGAWDVSKGKLAGIANGTRKRVAETTGGKIAAAIKAREAASGPQGETATAEENTLSAGADKSVDAAAEVAAFRDRNPDPDPDPDQS